jgi:hypothetical protein
VKHQGIAQIISKRVQEVEPVGGEKGGVNRVADSRRSSEVARPPKFKEFMITGP